MLKPNDLRWPLSEYAERMKRYVVPEGWGPLYALISYAQQLEDKVAEYTNKKICDHVWTVRTVGGVSEPGSCQKCGEGSMPQLTIGR